MPTKVKMVDPHLLSDHKFNILRSVAHHGALTTRRLVRDHGPRVTWYALIEQGYLKAVRTMYGEIIGLSPGSYVYYRARNTDPVEPGDRQVDYLMGPTLLADRAFQNDALEVLEREGYRVIERTYRAKPNPKQQEENGKKMVGNGKPDGHILRYTLRVPAHVAELLAQDRRPVLPFAWGDFHRSQSQRGYPYLVGSIGNGGIKAARLRALLREHEGAPSVWRHPLIVALPQNHGLDDLLRQVAKKYRDEEWGTSGIWMDWSYIGKAAWMPRLRIIELPCG